MALSDYIFDANAPAGDPSSYNALQMRQRIALAMLAGGKKGYPKTLGEGLTAIGDAIGDIGTMRRLEAQQAAYETAIQKVGATAPPLPPDYPSPAPTRSSATTDEPAPSRRVATLETPDETPQPERPEQPAPETPETPDPNDAHPIIRTNPDGTIAGNLTQPVVARPSRSLPPTPPPAQPPLPAPPSFFPSPDTARPSVNPATLNLGTDPSYRGSPRVGSNVAPWFASANAINAVYKPTAQGFGAPPLSPADAAQAARLSDVTGMGGGAGPPGAPTGQNPRLATRDAIAQLLSGQTAPGVPQPNPTPAAALSPPGSPAPAPGNRPIVLSDVRPMALRPGMQLAQAQTPPTGPLYVPPPLPPGMPPQVPPPGTPARPVPVPPAEPRVPVPRVVAPPVPQPVPKTQAQLEDERLLRQSELTGDPNLQKFYQDRVGKWEALRSQQDARNMDAWKAQQQVYETDKTRAETYRLNTPQRELELQKAEDERQARNYQETITRQLGGLSPATIEGNLKASKESVAGIPAATDSIRRARDLVDRMYHGPFADTETFLSKVMGASGFPLDPRASATEQFKTAMAGVMAQSRKAIVGPGSQSEAELALLQKSTAADAKLTPDTIKETLNAAERLNLKTALAHQQLVRRYAGETDPDRQGMVYGAFGVPTQAMVDLVPQSAVNKLFQYADNPEAHKVFDDKFHTPGLSRQVLQLRRPQ